MHDSRRSFLSSLAATGVSAVLPQNLLNSNFASYEQFPPPPEPADKFPTVPQQRQRTKNNTAALVAHEKELRVATDQLLAKVQEFRAQLDGTHTAEVFSVNMYKQTEDIEKLAKLLRNRARP